MLGQARLRRVYCGSAAGPCVHFSDSMPFKALYRLPERRFFSQRRVFAALQVIHKKEFSFKVLHSSGMSFYRKAHFNKMHAACTVSHSHGKMERPGFKKLQRPDLSHSMVLRLLQHLLL